MCIYERQGRLLLSSDHVLERISPHVGLYFDRPGDPLGDYLDSLERVSELEVDRVLPGHGPVLGGLGDRVRSTVRHHELRTAGILSVLRGAPATAAQIAARLDWLGSADGWERLDLSGQQSAVGETLAHLPHLEAEDLVAAEGRGADRVRWLAS